MKNNRGFGIGILIAIIALLVGGGVAYYKVKNSNNLPKLEENNSSLENQNSDVTTNNSPKDTSSTSDKNGKYIGYIKSISSVNGSCSLEIDYIQWLTNKDAIRAALEDNQCAIKGKSNAQAIAELVNYDISMGFGIYGLCAPNGFYVRNQNTLLRNFPISNSAVISTITKPSSDGLYDSLQAISLASFKNLFQPNTIWTNTIPFWITLNNGIITEISEQYIP